MASTINVKGSATRKYHCDRIQFRVLLACQSETVNECVSAVSDALQTYLSAIDTTGAIVDFKSNPKYERLVERHQSTGINRNRTPAREEQIGYKCSQELTFSTDYSLLKVVEVLKLTSSREHVEEIEVSPYVADNDAKRESLIAEAMQIALGKAKAACKALDRDLGELTTAEVGVNAHTEHSRAKSSYGGSGDVLSQCEIDGLLCEVESVQSATELVTLTPFTEPMPITLYEEVKLTFAVQ